MELLIMWASIKNFVLNKVLLKGVVTDILKRLDGYKTIVGLLLSVLQLVAFIVAKVLGSSNPILETVIETVSGAGFQGPISPTEIGLLASSLLAVYGIIMKAVKAAKGLPQVPELIKK